MATPCRAVSSWLYASNCRLALLLPASRVCHTVRRSGSLGAVRMVPPPISSPSPIRASTCGQVQELANFFEA